MSLYEDPVTPTPPAPAADLANKIRNDVRLWANRSLDFYGTCQQYLNDQSATKQDVVSELGADAATLNSFATKLRAALVALDTRLGPRFDALTK